MATPIKLTLMLLCCAISICFGQKQLATLKIGDKIPDVELSTYSGGKTRISSLYRDAPLIIDFWATWCVPCIKEIRLTDSLKQRHPGKFNVLLVSSQSQKTINEFLVRPTNKDLSRLIGAIVSADTVLAKLFPHKTIPHNIWIDRSGIIRAITSGEEINKTNLLGFAENPASLSLSTKKDNLNFRPKDSFYIGDSTFTYRSIISPHVEGVPSGEISPTRGSMQKYSQFNTGLLRALWGAYSGFNSGMRPNLMEIHTADSTRFFPPKKFPFQTKNYLYTSKAEWNQKNLFCYSLILPGTVPDSIFASYIFQDIERQFQIKSNIAQRMTKCMVVTNLADSKLAPGAIVQNQPSAIRFTNEQKMIIKAATIDELLDFLFRTGFPESRPFPFINETTYPKAHRFDLEIDFSGEPNIKTTGITTEMIYRRLNAFGLIFTESIRRYPVLVINDLQK